jgi:hypothetical protein
LSFQAYLDDSRSNNRTFILAGYIATVERWEAFEQEWRELLQFCPRNKLTGQRYFKMSEMMSNKTRRTHIQKFFKVIQNNVLTSISCRMNVKNLSAAKRRIVFPNCDIDWNYIENPYFFAIRVLLDQFHIRKSEWSQFIPTDEPVDFVFDEDSDKATQAMVISEWPRYIQNCSDETRGLYGACPRFKDDEVVLQLQAADFWAWWVRKCTDDGSILNELEQHVFHSIDLDLSEDQIVQTLMSLAPPDAPDPIDTKYPGKS